MDNQNEPIDFKMVIQALLDDNAAFPVEYFVEFSDIAYEDLYELKNIWHEITPQRKAKLFENLEIIYESDFTKDFSQLALLGLDDENSVIRASSIRLLADIESRRLIQPLSSLLLHDADTNVRAQAAIALGHFVFLGELEEIPEEDYEQLEEVLLSVLADDESELVRQKALESIGYSGREEIKAFIQNAYLSANHQWTKSAVVAMGRSADEFWEEQVLTSLINPNAYIQREAIRAAGELEIKAARKLLLKFILNDELDEDARTAAVWSLSKIGGEGIDTLIHKLMDETEDEIELMFLDDALDNLQLTNGILPDLDFLDIQETDSSQYREFSMDDSEQDLSDALYRNSWLRDMYYHLDEQTDDDMDDDEFETLYDDEDDEESDE